MKQDSYNDITEQLGKQLIAAMLQEQRSSRRWRNFRFMVWLTMIIISCYLLWHPFYCNTPPSKGRYIALLKMHGSIDPDGDFSAENILPILQEAFADPKAVGVILNINSGGGAPVQASIIHDAIVYYKNKYHKKVIAVGEDFLASGAYYIAVAADKIYVNPNTVTGSVGVIMKGFGFSELLKKLGIERRIYMSGVAKDRFDPFLPQNANDAQKAQQILTVVQNNFQKTVLTARGQKIHGDYDKIFNGDFWSGYSAVQLGLVDKLGNLIDAMNQEFHTTKHYDYSSSSSILTHIKDFIGTNINQALSTV
jgi:protease-4